MWLFLHYYCTLSQSKERPFVTLSADWDGPRHWVFLRTSLSFCMSAVVGKSSIWIRPRPCSHPQSIPCFMSILSWCLWPLRACMIIFQGLINIISCSIYSVPHWLNPITSSRLIPQQKYSGSLRNAHCSLYHVIQGEPSQIAGRQKSIRKQGLSQEYAVSNSEAWK